MGMNATPSSERLQIGLFGQRNAGKSSLINAITGQAVALVSETPGTTTDPVRKAMELPPIGPVLLIDTPGFDDEGGLGELRVARSRQILDQIDLALLVMDGCRGKTEADETLERLFSERKLPFLRVYTKSDLCVPSNMEAGLRVSAQSGENIAQLKEAIAALAAARREPPPLVADLVQAGDLVLLVTPIDESAPKGRLILPQQQTIRELLDAGALPLLCKETELRRALSSLAQAPALVITDSQVFDAVAAQTPAHIPLTSFSILMARRKGLLAAAVQGIAAIGALKDGDEVLICEGCTHHRQCGDIGSVKLPRWLAEYSGAALGLSFSSGQDFPEDLSKHALVVHCGGCMLSERTVSQRVRAAGVQGVPITNYGTLIAHINGILPRSLGIFPELQALLQPEGG